MADGYGGSNITSKEKFGFQKTLVQRKQNIHGSMMLQQGRFLMVTEYGGGGRRSVVVIPEGYEGLGWEKFAMELRRAADMLFADGSKKEIQKKNENINLEVNHKDPSTSIVARRSYAVALKTGHASGVHSEGIDNQIQLVAMHNSFKEMETQLIELKVAIAFLSTKIDLLSTGGNRVVRNKTKIGPNPLNSDKGK
ncbi:hypothetical protein F2P56_034026 [Juglans regia]|uniref:Uncharacterized protein n=1 Tax=Juglans regia TaxID=51240 RepID=A0A833T919_JUGRE|nr:hypothetical protein F2P56_034026 [Juglans regia]